MAHSLMVCIIDIHQLASTMRNRLENALILDSRSFLEYNTSHIINAVNVGCAKLMKRRLQQEKLCIEDFLAQNCHWDVDRSMDIIVYDQNTQDSKYLPPDSFMAVFLQKLLPVYNSVNVLKGGFLEFQAAYPDLCENERITCGSLTSLSQPCLPITNHGPTRILPFVYLGSQHDALDRDVLQHHNITYQLNVSTSCPKPEFIQDSYFMRIPVIDNYSDKLLSHFSKAFQFLDKVKESGGCVLIHCLAGISRSATVAIAFVMRTLGMTSDEAYRFVKAKRPTISPNFNFLGQLLEYEKQLQRESESICSSSPSRENFRSFCEISGSEIAFISCYAQNSEKHSLKYDDISEIKTSKKMFQSSDDSFGMRNTQMSCDRNISHKLDDFTYRILTKQQQPTGLNIKCQPVSSLKELNFTSCHTSSFNTKSDTLKSFLAPKTAVGIKRDERKVEIQRFFPDYKPNVGRNATFFDSSSPSESFEFGSSSKLHTRSDSVSTSGLGSEGSDYADASWSVSCERDILMDDDDPSVPNAELQQNKLLDDFDDAMTLYPDGLYRKCHRKDYPQAVPCSAQNCVMKCEPTLDFNQSKLHPTPNAEELGKPHLLYRAQSCPGMLSSASGTSENLETVLLNGGVKLRKSKLSKFETEKFRNRYSCSSIDYMDFSLNTGLSHESPCPPLHLTLESGREKISSHCSTYSHNLIEVS